MSDQILKLKEELNQKLAAELNFEKDVRNKVLESINKFEEKRPSFLLQKVISGVVLSGAIAFLALFTYNQINGSSTIFEKSASQPSQEERFTYHDPDFGFELELPSYIEHHIRTFDSENGRTFYFINDNGPEQLLFHLDIYQKSESIKNLDIPNRLLVRETNQYVYYVSDINENIQINQNSYSEDATHLLEKFALDFPTALLSFKPVVDSQFGWSVKSVESHQNQVALAVDQARELLEKEYPSNEIALKNQGKQQYLAEIAPYEVNKIRMKMIVGINTKFGNEQHKAELNHYLASYELIDGEWEKIEWKKIEE
jgi:hypothetical protein